MNNTTVNYYDELDIDKNSSLADIKKSLSKNRKKWSLRLNAPTLEKRQEAETKLALLDDAISKFENEQTRKNYDNSLSLTHNDFEEMSFFDDELFDDELFDDSEFIAEYQENSNQNYDQQHNHQHNHQHNQQHNHQHNQQNNQQNNQQSMYEQAFSEYRSKNYQVAINNSEYLIQNGNNNIDLYEILSDSYRQLSNYDRAVDIAVSGLKIVPDNYYLHFILVMMYMRHYANYEQTFKYLSAWRKLYSRDERVLVLQFQYYLNVYGCCQLSYSKADEIFKHIDKTEKLSAEIADIFLCYSDTKLRYTQKNYAYLSCQKDYDEYLKARKKAVKYSNTQNIKQIAKEAKELGSRSYNKEATKYWVGVFIIAMIIGNVNALASLGSNILCFLGLILLYTAFEPEWAKNTRLITGKDNTIPRCKDYIKEIFSFFRKIFTAGKDSLSKK